MRELLARPVAFGDLELAPTTELAGLAELAEIRDHRQRIDALLRISAAVAAEDAERDRIADLRRNPVPSLPRRA